ncbi:aspartate carbamoyltransferase [Candidatus Micrarchaeota archaeon]|nr:aspartate carbamoyltransferase [Candidatus Micrarchaeota archaeon]
MDLISFMDLGKEEIERYLEDARKMEEQLKEGKVKKHDGIVATLFFEPSTRTKLSFQSASHRLGLDVIDFSAERSSIKKGESFEDTIRMIDNYADVLVIRHPEEGSAELAAKYAESPVINAGDGSNQHPSQTLLDLYAIKKMKGKIEGLEVHLVGDLKYARVMRPLMYGLAMFGAKVKLASPTGLGMPKEAIEEAKEKYGAEIEETTKIDFSTADVAYVCRVQEERFANKSEAEEAKKGYTIKPGYLEAAKEGMILLHPLPKRDEIPPEVAASPQARYLEQARCGVPVRMAIIKKILEGRK